MSVSMQAAPRSRARPLPPIAARVDAELARMVGTLEERHDSYMEDNPLRSPLMDEDGELPTADSIAAELEKFLAFRRGSDDDRTH